MRLLVVVALAAVAAAFESREPVRPRPPDIEAIVDKGLELGKEFEAGAQVDESWVYKPRRRFSEGGHANMSECEAVMSLADLTNRVGRQCIQTHEIYGARSPYTPRELVATVRAHHAVRLAEEDPSLMAPVSTFLTLANRVRERVMREFNEPKLKFHLTEILCREPRIFTSDEECIAEACAPFCPSNCVDECAKMQGLDATACTKLCADECREHCTAACTSDDWLSHPIHADANPEDCDLLDDGTCIRRLPEDVTSHMYLNENFEGGQFFFTSDFEGASREYFQPTCGRILGYSSGFENMHGVTAVKSGRRCHITIWFTKDDRKVEELPLPYNHEFLQGRRAGPGRA